MKHTRGASTFTSTVPFLHTIVWIAAFRVDRINLQIKIFNILESDITFLYFKVLIANYENYFRSS